MRTPRSLPMLALAGALMLSGCALWRGGTGGWETLVDGVHGIDNFYPVGKADWVFLDGAIAAGGGDRGGAYLVSRQSYGDFALRAEFWVSDDAVSGIFMRCQNAWAPSEESCYDASIFDQRPDPAYATGALVKVAPVVLQPRPKAGGRWNRYEITMKGNHLVVVLNGVKSVDVRDARFADGPVALQWAGGLVKWRKLEIRRI